MEEKKVPALRFRGFDNAWEQRRVGDISEIVGGGTPDTTNPMYWEGDIDWYAPAEMEDKIYADSSERKITSLGFQKCSAKMLPANRTILFTSRAGIGKTAILRHSACTNQGFQSLVLMEGVIPYFVYAMSGQLKQKAEAIASGSTFAEISGRMLGNIDIMIPQNKEQEVIGSYFQSLDHLISLHQRKLEMLKKVKKSMLEKMFPKNDAKVPELRFSDFTDAWEQCKVNSLFEPLTERNDDLLPYSKTLSVATMTYKEVGNGAADSSLANYKRLRLGDVAFEGHTSKEFRYGRFVLNDAGDGIMSPRFSALRPISELPVQFWKYYIHYEPIMKRSLVNCTKAGTMMNELVVPEFLQESLLVPSTDEQVQIGKYFANLNHLIILHQRKLEKLKNIKKSMLEKMFII